MNEAAQIPVKQLPSESAEPVSLYKKHEPIHAHFVGGYWQQVRKLVAAILLIGFFAGPWLTWHGQQAILLDLPARQFHLFGLNIWPQDLWMLGWLLMMAALGLFAITNVVGRLWCGYICPQTVWTTLFMWVERHTEGSARRRKKLAAEKWGTEKVLRRAAKYTGYFLISALTAATFVAYFTPAQALFTSLATLNVLSLEPWTQFWLLFFTAATLFAAGWAREQMCIYMCPYARFQGSMIDDDTLTVSYDANRGDPRGSRKQSGPLGDCIDCRLCVQVCPTGIDIRDGLQYQCIGCAHCIDACNQVMGKIGREQNLIGYTSLNVLQGKPFRWLRPRSVGYAAVCAGLAAAFLFAVVNRATIDLDLLRDRGSLYQVRTAGLVSNEYQLKAMNKGSEAIHLSVTITSPTWLTIEGNVAVDLQPGELRNLPLTLVATRPPAGATDVQIALCQRDHKDQCVSETTSFIAPRSSRETSS